MIVDWDPKATNGRENIADYIREKFGITRERKFKQNVEHTIETICEYPNIGTIDPLFSERTEVYRSLLGLPTGARNRSCINNKIDKNNV